MVEISTFNASVRTQQGSRSCRKLRKHGQIPGNVYGHTQDSVAITVDGDTLTRAVLSGHKIVDVNLDGKVEKTILREVQWNTFATEILHFDLMRIDANERVSVTVPVVVKGMAPGVTAGGILEQPVHEIEISVLALEMVDSITVRISDMKIGDVKHLSDLELPPSAEVDLPPETVILQVTEAQAVPETDEEAEAGPLEPELIGRSADKEDED